MRVKLSRGVIAAAVVLSVSGCASYRVSSNVEAPPAAPPTSASAAPATKGIVVTEGDIADRRYETLGVIEVSVKKLTLFHKDPTREQANEALVERARAMGADAVIKVQYKSGIGLTTWGYMDAHGVAVRFLP